MQVHENMLNVENFCGNNPRFFFKNEPMRHHNCGILFGTQGRRVCIALECLAGKHYSLMHVCFCHPPKREGVGACRASFQKVPQNGLFCASGTGNALDECADNVAMSPTPNPKGVGQA